MQALTSWNAKIMSTRTTAGQFKSQFKGAKKVLEGSESKRTKCAWFWYTFASFSVASPPKAT